MPARGSDELSSAEARRVALRAQGFGTRAGVGPAGRQVVGLVRRIGVIQLDSVNVVSRSQYLPVLARLGPYPRETLDHLAYSRRALFEYWGHEASLLPVGDQPLFRWRMARARSGETWRGPAELARRRPGYVERVLAEVVARGPLTASELSDPGPRGGPWWGWADGKRALEWHFWTGALTTAGRRGFERVYDLTERVLPARVLAEQTPSEQEARAALLLRAAAALGVATAADLADYYRLRGRDLPGLLAGLRAGGLLRSVRVEGWAEPAYVLPTLVVPRHVPARALLSPFDSLIWSRPRTQRLFGFRYRTELYTPAERRVHGYYVLPFLAGDGLVARVDLKADRRQHVLVVRGAFGEPVEVNGAPGGTAHLGELASALAEMAAWLGLERVSVEPRGDLAAQLAAAVTPA